MAVDLNTMAASIQTVLAAVPGIAAAYDHEPQQLNPLPAATIYFDGFDSQENSMGRLQYGWRWTIRIYVPISIADIKQPQTTIRTLTTDAVKAFRQNITINNSCLFSTVDNGDIFNIMDATNPLMVSEITLVATTQENR